MIVTKKALPRRGVLRGLGATLALPFLDAMVPAMSALAKTPGAAPRRLGFIYLPNGVSMNFSGVNYWKPRSEGANFEMSPILTTVTPFTQHLIGRSGLTHHQADASNDGANDDRSRGTST